MNRNKYGSSTASSSSYSTKKVDTKLLTEDYKKYEDKTSKRIKDDGIEKMGSTLGIDIYSDLFITYFFFRCQCKTYGEVSLDEYTKGLTSFGANNLGEVKPHIITVKEDLLNIHSDDFKKFYMFLFTFNLEKKTVKVVNPEVYKLYFTELFGSQFRLPGDFLEFMEKDKQNAKLTEDQWNLFLELLKAIGDDFPKNYNVEESWPTLFDEFYVWFCNKYSIEIPKPEY